MTGLTFVVTAAVNEQQINEKNADQVKFKILKFKTALDLRLSA
jgi:hypothetical protein